MTILEKCEDYFLKVMNEINYEYNDEGKKKPILATFCHCYPGITTSIDGIRINNGKVEYHLSLYSGWFDRTKDSYTNGYIKDKDDEEYLKVFINLFKAIEKDFKGDNKILARIKCAESRLYRMQEDILYHRIQSLRRKKGAASQNELTAVINATNYDSDEAAKYFQILRS